MRKPLTNDPCPRCISLMVAGTISAEWIQRLPQGAFAPHAVDGTGPCCSLCGYADTFAKFTPDIDFGMARVVVGQDWAEGLRLPGVRLGASQMVPPSQPGDLDAHYEWLHNTGLISDAEWLGATQ